jgi:hypothetical protein
MSQKISGFVTGDDTENKQFLRNNNQSISETLWVLKLFYEDAIFRKLNGMFCNFDFFLNIKEKFQKIEMLFDPYIVPGKLSIHVLCFDAVFFWQFLFVSIV